MLLKQLSNRPRHDAVMFLVRNMGKTMGHLIDNILYIIQCPILSSFVAAALLVVQVVVLCGIMLF